MNQQTSIGGLTATLLLLCITSVDAKPNVLFIAIDDLRPELGCYGDSHIHSPNIDGLAASGRMFQRAYCQQAVCNPSRTSLMTGLRPDTIGVTGNHIHFRSNRPDVVTLSQHFKQHGYHAQSIGKIYHGVFSAGASKTKWDTMGDSVSWSVPTTRFGPRYYYTESGIAQAKESFVKMYRARDPKPDDWTEKLVFGPMTEAPEVSDATLFDGKVAAKAVETIAELAKAKQPFFLAVGFIKPHSPFVAPKEYWDIYDPAEIPIALQTGLPTGAPDIAGHRSGEIRRYTDQPNKGDISEQNQRRMKHGYYACISYVDAQLGKVMNALESNGLANNTIVVLFGDHGYHLGEHGLWGKTTNFELDTRVPLIIRVPGMSLPGNPTRSLAELVDLYPTLAELAGLPVTGDLEGTSLRPVIADPSAQSNETAVSQFPRGKAIGYSLRTDNWRYTEWIKNGEAIARELYDHQRDNSPEVDNVASNNVRLVSQLSDQLHKKAFAPQTITSVTVENVQVPVLIGLDRNPLKRIRIEVTGTHEPLSVIAVKSSISGSVTNDDIDQVELLVADDLVRTSKNATQYGETFSGVGEHSFRGKRQLKHGTNYLWLSCSLKAGANIDHVIQAACKSISFSDGKSQQLQNADVDHRLGVAVRQSRQDGVHTSRIPGLATTNKGTLIGVYDLRYRSGGDLPGNIDVGMSRSTDGGKTWEPNRVIMDMGDDKEWRYDGIGDPAVLVDKNTGTIWVAATWSHGNRSWTGSGPGLEPAETGQFVLVRSDDDGVTWSDPINITEQVKRPEWCFLLAGPGKGITMRDGTIVFAAQFQLPEEQKRQPHSTIIYSQDHGKTWQTGTGAFGDTTESQVVEIEPGMLMLNCRYDLDNVRVVMTTRDMGKTWQQHSTSLRALIEPKSCMASLIDVDQELGKNVGTWLLFSNPDDTESRRRIMIKASSDGGQSWPKHHRLLLDEGRGAGYSCMTMIDKETVGILYEGSRAQMTFQRVPLSALTNPDVATVARRWDGLTHSGIPDANHALASVATLSLPRVFSDHMVLQADHPIPIWGTAKPGTAVEVRFDDERERTTASETGHWQVRLKPRRPSDRPSEMVVTSEKESIQLGDILVGEVWVCAGQSNMEWPLKQSTDAAIELADADQPNLRLLNFEAGARGSSGSYVSANLKRLTPQTFFAGEWEVASARSAQEFSAVGWHFGRHLGKSTRVPIGLINVSVGGTPTEAWIPREALGRDPPLQRIVTGNWLDNDALGEFCRTRGEQNLLSAIQAGEHIPGDDLGPNHSFKPGFMWSAGIEPLIPLAIRGVLWYQGESNAETVARVRQHERLFPMLVNEWRSHWGQGKFPFLFVQLPALNRPHWPLFRDSQRRMAGQLKNVGMAVAIDTGHPTDVHPRDKQPVGERLAMLARNSSNSGPLLDRVSKDDKSILIRFKRIGDRLQSSDGEVLRHFEICGSDRVFQAASAKIIGNDSIGVSSPLVDHPQEVRYAWKPYPEPKVNLVNGDQLPASPFTTEANSVISPAGRSSGFGSSDRVLVKGGGRSSVSEPPVRNSNTGGCNARKPRLSTPATRRALRPGRGSKSDSGVPFLAATASDLSTRERLHADRDDTRPNILLIVGEDHGCELSCYGDPVIETPNIDALAKSGCLFENGYVTQSVCSPSRSTIFTGLYPHQNGQLGLATHGYSWFKKWPTTYSILKQAGYRTGLIGKTHINPEEAVESFVDFRFQQKSNFAKKKVADYATKAGEFFRDGDEPFFMTVNYPDAHWPLQGKVDGLPTTRVAADKIKVMPYIGGETPRMRKVVRNYYDCMLRLDQCVGQLLDELKKSGKDQNTLVVFIGDHGAQMARGKVTVYEGGMRVPYIVRWPSIATTGERSKALVSTIDLLPTFAGVADAEVPKGLPGKSLCSLLDGTADDESFRDYIACERNCDAAMHTFPQRTIRDARYKLIYSPIRDREDPAARYYRIHGATHWSGCLTDEELQTATEQTKLGYARWLNPPEYQLYDLHSDPHEWNDLGDSPQHAETKARLRLALTQWQSETDDPITDENKLRMLMDENDAVAKTELRWPESGWHYLQYLRPE